MNSYLRIKGWVELEGTLKLIHSKPLPGQGHLPPDQGAPLLAILGVTGQEDDGHTRTRRRRSARGKGEGGLRFSHRHTGNEDTD